MHSSSENFQRAADEALTPLLCPLYPKQALVTLTLLAVRHPVHSHAEKQLESSFSHPSCWRIPAPALDSIWDLESSNTGDSTTGSPEASASEQFTEDPDEALPTSSMCSSTILEVFAFRCPTFPKRSQSAVREIPPAKLMLYKQDCKSYPTAQAKMVFKFGIMYRPQDINLTVLRKNLPVSIK